MSTPAVEPVAPQPAPPPLARRVVESLPRGLRGVAWAGIGVGLLGAFIALPPASVRSWIPSLLLCLLAGAVGVWVFLQGDRRFGSFAVATGVLGFVLAYLATLSGIGKLETVVVWSALFAAMLRYATPLVFASIGGMFSERSGVVNIGLEGMMLMGAFFAILVADKTDSWAIGLGAGMLAGGLAALVHAFFAIHLRADQIVVGTAVNFLALGLTGYLYIDVYGQEGTPTDLPSIPDVHLGFLKDVPFVGDIFGQLNLMIWLALLLIVVSWLVMFRTPIGLRIRSVGEHPRAADTVGINVYAVRYGAVVLSGMLAAAGGAYLSIGFVNSFSENMTQGRGFIALAALIFGNWRPFGAAAACMLFGFSQALAQRLPEYSQSASVLFQALPYVLTLIAVAGVIGRSIPPAAVGRPYKKQ
jgi:simple sugar transport system permease protein